MKSNLCLHQLFQQQATRTPDEIAAVDAYQQLSYQQLDQLTDQLAGYLHQQGIGPDEAVGILMEKSVEYIVAYIAILKAGGAYMPLDLANPDPMLQQIVSETQPKVILSKQAYADRLPDYPAETRLIMDDLTVWQEYRYDPTLNPPTLDNLAYIVYSSGTTGKPKGILAPHRGSVHSYLCRHEFSNYQPGDRVACNIFFVWELLRPLLKGGTVYVVPDETIYDPEPLLAFIVRHKITEILFTPSLLETVINTVTKSQLRNQFASLQVIWLNGEVVTTTLKNRLISLLPEHIRLLNTYSISECHDVSNEDLRHTKPLLSGVCSVGSPIPGIDIKLLDVSLNEVPQGEVGELYVGGPGVARGYLNKPKLTAERFVYRDDDCYYRTGDLAVLHLNGKLEIRGRCDFMVKIRGYSVHLGSVEAMLLDYAGVKSCAVVTEGAEGEDKRLVAYVVRDDTATWKIDTRSCSCIEIQNQIKPYLPHYMIPNVYIELSETPINPVTGKIDRKQLPTPPPRQHRTSLINLRLSQEPTIDEQMQVMSQLWEQVLQLESGTIQPHASFFDFGGHSLLAVKLTQAIDTVFGQKIMVKDIYHHVTAEALVYHLNQDAEIAEPVISLQQDAMLDPTIVPASASQSTMLSEAKSIFLTGVTGFVGAFLLAELLHVTPETTKLHCLVRASKANRSNGLLRIVNNLKQYQLWHDSFTARIVPVLGDLAQPMLGLLPETFTEYSQTMDMIFHCGALVNYVYSYDILKPAMINGTQEILRLACEGRKKPLHYVSTNGIFPDGESIQCLETQDIDEFADLLTGGYPQAKWVAEKLVWQAVDRGLSVIIYRPGNVGPHTQTGVTNLNDFQFMILDACQQLQQAPDCDDWLLEMTPVDFLVRAIVTLANQPEHFGRVYHAVQPDPIAARQVFDILKAQGHIDGYISLEAWKTLMYETAETEDKSNLNVLAQALEDVEGYLVDARVYDNRHFMQAVRASGLERPPVDSSYFERAIIRRFKK